MWLQIDSHNGDDILSYMKEEFTREGTQNATVAS